MGAKDHKDTVTLYEDARAKPHRSTKTTVDNTIHGTPTSPHVVDKRDTTPNVKQNSDGWKATDPTTDRERTQMAAYPDVTPSFASQQIIAEDAGNRVDHRQTEAKKPSTSGSTTTTSPSSDTVKKPGVILGGAAPGISQNNASVPIEIKHDGLTEKSGVETTNTASNLHRAIGPVPDPPRAESKWQNDSQDIHVLPSTQTELRPQGLFPAHGESPPVVKATRWEEIVSHVRNSSRRPAQRSGRTRRPQPPTFGNIIPDTTGVDQRSSEIAFTDTNNHFEKLLTRPKALSEGPIRRETPPREPNKQPMTIDNAIQELPIAMQPSQSTIPSSPKEVHGISLLATGELPVPENQRNP